MMMMIRYFVNWAPGYATVAAAAELSQTPARSPLPHRTSASQNSLMLSGSDNFRATHRPPFTIFQCSTRIHGVK